ncbi:MAG: hypothetical protein RL238_1336 [Actinomycetota bacterium]|jgi:hypothetical protein
MASVEFDTTLLQFGNNTGIEVPRALIDELGAGQRPPVLVNVNGFEFRTTVGVMSGKHLVGVTAATRKATGLAGGDAVHVVLTLATAPREVNVPDDFAAAMAANPPSADFFAGLSNSVQRFHIDNVNGAKTDETRQRRIEKAVALFLAGKPR